MPATDKYRSERLVSWKRLLTTLLVLGGLSLAGWQGWAWRANVHCERIVVTGAERAERDSLTALAQVAVGDLLFAIDPNVVADRIRRHPWVAAAKVSRLPTGTLRIEVVERAPVLVAEEGAGSPAYYIDAHGYRMPLATDTLPPLPFIRGLDEPYHPVRPLRDSTVHALAGAVAELYGDRLALIDGFERRADGDFVLFTAATLKRPAIPVRLGERDFRAKLRRLFAFWRQGVMPGPETRFDYVDLRFERQIVTREYSAITN